MPISFPISFDEYLKKISVADKAKQFEEVIKLGKEAIEYYGDKLTSESRARLSANLAKTYVTAYSSSKNPQFEVEAINAFKDAVAHSSKQDAIKWLQELININGFDIARTVHKLAAEIYPGDPELIKQGYIFQANEILQKPMLAEDFAKVFKYLNGLIEKYPEEEFFANMKTEAKQNIFKQLLRADSVIVGEQAGLKYGDTNIDFDIKGDLEAFNLPIEQTSLSEDATKKILDEALCAAEKPDIAIEKYSEIIAAKPTCCTVTAYVNRGTAYYNQGNYEQALRDFNHALEINAAEPTAMVNRGNALLQLGHSAMAKEAYQNAFSTCHANTRAGTEALHGLARIAIAEHDYKQAHNYLDQALLARPNFYAAHIEKCAVLAYENKFSEAKQCFEQIPTGVDEYELAQTNINNLKAHLGESNSDNASFTGNMFYSLLKGLFYTAAMNSTKHVLAKQNIIPLTTKQADYLVRAVSVGVMIYNGEYLAATAASGLHMINYIWPNRPGLTLITGNATAIGASLYTHSSIWQAAQAFGGFTTAAAAGAVGFWCSQKIAEKTGLAAAPADKIKKEEHTSTSRDVSQQYKRRRLHN